MNSQKKMYVLAAIGLAALGVGGCATQQEITSAGLAAQPVISSAQQVAMLTGQASTAAQNTVSQAVTLQAREPAALQAPAAQVVAGAQAAAAKISQANTAAANNVKISQALPARIVGTEQKSASIAAAAVKNTWSYKLGHILLVTVFLLLVFGGLIIFSESGFASVLAVKWPILATVMIKPLEYLGMLVGKLWGFVESGLAGLWQAVARNVLPSVKTLS